MFSRRNCRNVYLLQLFGRWGFLTSVITETSWIEKRAQLLAISLVLRSYGKIIVLLTSLFTVRFIAPKRSRV